jgi:hypothetical protein
MRCLSRMSSVSGRHPQPPQERRERLRKAQVGRPLPGLFGDRLQLGAQRLLPLAQLWHPVPQLLKRQEFLLIGGEQSLDDLANTHQLALKLLLTLFRWVGSARGARKLRGHNNYYGIPGNSNALSPFPLRSWPLWRKWLDRRSDKACMTWERFNRLLRRYPLPSPVVRYGLARHAANP